MPKGWDYIFMVIHVTGYSGRRVEKGEGRDAEKGRGRVKEGRWEREGGQERGMEVIMRGADSPRRPVQRSVR